MDFISSELVEREALGHKFKFRELTGREIDEIADKALKVEDNKVTFSIGAKREGYLSAIEEIDFPEWKNLRGKEERLNFLNKLKSPLRLSIIEKIQSFHEEVDETLKK